MAHSAAGHPGHYERGDRIAGRWQVQSLLGGAGDSGIGVVYLVTDAREGTRLAVKMFQPWLTSTTAIKETIREEAESWARLARHPNIVSVEHVGPRESPLFILMEYVDSDAEGRASLADHLEGLPLSPRLIERWIVDLCLGMAHAESHGLKAHRDLKPDNLLACGQTGRLKITDFGLSRLDLTGVDGIPIQGTTSGRPGLGVVGNIVGTPGYMAPELVKHGRSDIRGDVYSFGLILYQMLTGDPRPPLCGEWEGQAWNYEQQNLVLRKQGISGLGSKYDELLRRCLDYSPERRFRRFGEILAYLDDESLVSQVPST